MVTRLSIIVSNWRKIFVLTAVVAFCSSASGQGLLENKGGVSYDHGDLQAGLTQTFTIPDANCVSDLCGPNWKALRLVIELTLADDYADITPSTSIISSAVDVSVTGVRCSFLSIPDYELTQRVEVNTDKPTQVFVVDITDEYGTFTQVDVDIDGYTVPVGYEGSVTLNVGYEGDFLFSLGGKSVSATTVSNPDVLTNSARTLEWDVAPCGQYGMYEVQIMRLYNTDEALADAGDPTDIRCDVDWEEALTIQTYSWNEELRLTLSEGTGYYLWRVRGIGNEYPGGYGNPDNWGAYSGTGATLVQGATNVDPSPFLGNSYLIYYDQFDEDKNWIHSRVFVEGESAPSKEVKIKEGISYHTGLLHGRQDQQRLNETNQVVGNQSVTDYSGRIALKGMQVPVDGQQGLKYKSDFMLSAGTSQEYNADDFDSDTRYLDPHGVKLDGASNSYGYFSEYNTTDPNIPSSAGDVDPNEGFPYTRTRFYKDGLTRRREHSIPGFTHRITNDPGTKSRTSEVFYGSVADAELIRVFGKEAPESKSVHKAIAIDPNKTTVVKYVNKLGQTIATCLALNEEEDATSSLIPLESRADAIFDVEEIIDPPMEVGPYTLQRTKDLVLTSSTSLEIFYELTANAVQDACANFCRTCDYEVTIQVFDKETETIVPGGTFNTTISPDIVCTGQFHSIPPLTVALTPGDYQVVQTLQANNAIGTSTQTYIESHLASLEAELQLGILGDPGTGLGGVLSDVMNFIDNTDIGGLYVYLAGNPAATLITETAPDGGVEEHYEFSIDLGNGECLVVDIPVLECQDDNCQLSDFLDLVNAHNTDPLSVNTIAYEYEYAPGLIHTFSQTELDDLINNMLTDYASADFDLCDIYGCWQNLILTYDALKETEAAVSSSPDGAGYDFNLINQFIICVRTARYPAGDYPIIDFDGSPLSPSPIYITNAHTHFFYTLGDNPPCEDWVVNTLGLNMADFNTTWTDEERRNFYLCVTNTDPFGSTDVSEYVDIVTDACEQACEDKREAFELELLDLYHSQGLVVEGDVYYYASVTMPTGVVQWIEDTDNPIPGGTPIDVSLEDLDCAVSALVENCKSYCFVADPPNITALEQQNIQNVLMGAFNVTLAENGDVCPPGSDLITPSLVNGTSISWDLAVADNLTPGGSKSLLDMDIGIGGGTISVLEGSRLVKMEGSGLIAWAIDYTSEVNNQTIRSVHTTETGYLITTDGYQIAFINAAGGVDWVQDYSSEITIAPGTFISSTARETSNGVIGLWYVNNGNFHEVLVGADDEGDFEWTQDQFFSTASTLERAVLESNGNDAIVGSVDGLTLYGVDGTDGTTQWTLNTYPTSFTTLRDIEQNEAGNFYVGGDNSSTEFMVYEIDGAGALVSGTPWTHNPGANAALYDVESTDDGGFLATGAMEVSANPEYTIVKANSGAITQWQEDFGSDGAESRPVSIEQSGGFIITGGTSEEGTSADKTNTTDPDPTSTNLEAWYIRFYYNNPQCRFDNLCFEWVDAFGILSGIPNDEVQLFEPLPCEEVAANDLSGTILGQVESFIVTQKTTFEESYESQCLDPANVVDEFKIKYQLGYYHYTLVYFDRAGNTVKTVPPQGVELQDLSNTLVMDRQVLPNHTHVKDYQYNSLGQLVRTHSVDAGEEFQFFDAISRVRFWQDEKQLANDRYSYKKYDRLNRLIEIGESTLDGAGQAFAANTNDQGYPLTGTQDWIKSVWSMPATGVDYLGEQQTYLRNRVSYVYTEAGVYTYFSYDPHGNVKWMIQELPDLGRSTIAYEYDVFGKNITMVRYNEGKIDQFFHRLHYDHDNRLVSAETSTDGVIWDEDMRSEYYQLGGRARNIIGQDMVQGCDYTYTLQGWIKGINHSSLDPTKDPGMDNSTNTVAQDVLGEVLSYYDGDYVRTGSVFNNADSDYLPGTHNLYNGNISAMAYQLPEMTYGGATSMVHGGDITGYQYRYDELNRIKEANFSTRDLAAASQLYASTSDYQVDYAYDANGNITTLNRNGHGTNLDMDHFTYGYAHLDAAFNPEVLTPGNYFEFNNQLDQVDDNGSGSYDGNYADDIDGVNDYVYDEIGQLTQDLTEDLQTIEWNHFNRVTRIVKTSGEEIRFTYDGFLNRIRKEVVHPSDINQSLTTYYICDPYDNTVAVYEKSFAGTSSDFVATYRLAEHNINGSQPVGLHKPVDLVIKEEDETGAETIVTQYEYKPQLTNWGIGSQTNFFSFFNLVGESRFNTENTGNAHNIFGFGLSGENHATLEDEDGNLVLTATTCRVLNGNPNTCVMRNASGTLIPGSTGIDSYWRGKSVFVKQPIGDVYYYLTVTAGGELKAHKVDLTGGTVTVVPNEFTLGTGYLQVVNAVEDHTGDFSTQVLALRNDGAGGSELVSFNVAAGGSPFGTPTVVTTYPTVSNGGDITVSPEGDKLGVAREGVLTFTFSAGWFTFTFSFPNATIYNYDYTDYQIASLNTTESLGVFAGCKNVEYSPLANHLFYQKRRFSDIAIKRWDLASTTVTVDPILGQVRRGEDDNMYIVEQFNNQVNDNITQVSSPDGAFTLSDITLMPTAGFFVVNYLRGFLPVQPHKVLPFKPELFTRCLGEKFYECKDHLGNVKVVVSDRKLYDNVDYTAQVVSISDYYPFGMLMPDRNLSAPEYRYGFQGQEKDDEIKGNGNSVNYMYRMHDPRLGRFFAEDPLTDIYPFNSSYAFSENRVIDKSELEGAETIEDYQRWQKEENDRRKAAEKQQLEDKLNDIQDAQDANDPGDNPDMGLPHITSAMMNADPATGNQTFGYDPLDTGSDLNDHEGPVQSRVFYVEDTPGGLKGLMGAYFRVFPNIVQAGAVPTGPPLAAAPVPAPWSMWQGAAWGTTPLASVAGNVGSIQGTVPADNVTAPSAANGWVQTTTVVTTITLTTNNPAMIANLNLIAVQLQANLRGTAAAPGPNPGVVVVVAPVNPALVIGPNPFGGLVNTPQDYQFVITTQTTTQQFNANETAVYPDGSTEPVTGTQHRK